MLELYTSEPNTFFLKPLIALHEKNAQFRHPLVRLRQASNNSLRAVPVDVEAHLHLEREGPLLRARWHADLELLLHARVHRRRIARRAAACPRAPSIATAPMRRDNFSAPTSARWCRCSVARNISLRDWRRWIAKAATQRWKRSNPSSDASIGTRCWTEPTRAEILDKARKRLEFPVQRVEATLSKDPWLAGPRYSIADIDAFSMLRTIPDLAPEALNPTVTPRVCEYLAQDRGATRGAHRAGDEPQRQARAVVRSRSRTFQVGMSTPVLLLPGLVCDAEVWAHARQALSARTEVRIADHGHLDSLGAMAEKVLREAPARFALAGHSMGGRVALEVMRRAPQRVAALALLDTGISTACAGRCRRT